MDGHMPLLLVASVAQVGLVAGALCRGLAVAVLAAQLVRVVFREPPAGSARNGLRGERLDALRRQCALFRWLEPFVVELSEYRLFATWSRKWQLQKYLDAGGTPLPWLPQELLALWVVQGVLVGLSVATMAGFVCSWPARVLLLLLAVVGVVLHRQRQFKRHTALRLLRIQQRLPYAIDLMALMMEAGAGFKESFTAVVRESEGHPLGDEFTKVLQELDCGQTLALSLQGLADRLRSEDISEMTLTVQTAEELGAPLSETFLELAERMRIKRSLWAEKRTGEAKASMNFPGIIIMVACLLIVVAPFILQAVYDTQNL